MLGGSAAAGEGAGSRSTSSIHAAAALELEAKGVRLTSYVSCTTALVVAVARDGGRRSTNGSLVESAHRAVAYGEPDDWARKAA